MANSKAKKGRDKATDFKKIAKELNKGRKPKPKFKHVPKIPKATIFLGSRKIILNAEE